MKKNHINQGKNETNIEKEVAEMEFLVKNKKTMSRSQSFSGSESSPKRRSAYELNEESKKAERRPTSLKRDKTQSEHFERRVKSELIEKKEPIEKKEKNTTKNEIEENDDRDTSPPRLEKRQLSKSDLIHSHPDQITSPRFSSSRNLIEEKQVPPPSNDEIKSPKTNSKSLPPKPLIEETTSSEEKESKAKSTNPPIKVTLVGSNDSLGESPTKSDIEKEEFNDAVEDIISKFAHSKDSIRITNKRGLSDLKEKLKKEKEEIERLKKN